MANLNIEQKKVKSLFQESKYNFLILDYQAHMRGVRWSVKLYGTICFRSLSQMMTVTNLLTMKSIFLVP